MEDTNLQKLVHETMVKEIGDVVVVLGYMEHQTDLIGSILIDIVNEVGETNLTEPTKGKIQQLREVMAYSSINFEALSLPTEGYKLPQTKASKQKMRDIQQMYLKAILSEDHK